MSRPLSLFVLASLAALPALAAQQSSYTFKGDGFDGSLSANDGCRDVQIYFSGSDYSTKAGPGQPQSSNYLWGYGYVFDCETQGWGWVSLDRSNATLDAKGPNSSSTLSGSFEVQFGHWEQSAVQTCYTYDGWCWTDWNGSEVCEAGGEYCYNEWNWIVDPSKTLALNVSIVPSGDTYRGMSMGMQKGPYGMYRYRYTGTQKYGTVGGTLTLDGEDLMAGAYSWANVWTATSGSMSVYKD